MCCRFPATMDPVCKFGCIDIMIEPPKEYVPVLIGNGKHNTPTGRDHYRIPIQIMLRKYDRISPNVARRTFLGVKDESDLGKTKC